MSKRSSVPKDNETEVLVRSRRRCCLCTFLNGDLSIKKLQIAHLDRNPRNNKVDNLVALCLDHHDEYDSKTSQSKGITTKEIKHYRAELDKIIRKQDEQLLLPIVGTHQYGSPSAKLLGQVLSAFDDDMLRLQNNRRSTGIALARLARTAIEEEGDFDVAKEAFISLIRLSSAAKEKGYDISIRQPVPTATPTLAAMETLILMKKDFSLFIDTIHRGRLLALIGDSPFSALSHYSAIPHGYFDAITSVLYEACINPKLITVSWASDTIVEELTKLLLGLGFILKKQGISISEPPSTLFIGADGKRWIGEGQAMELLPFVQLCNKLASVPQNLFQHAITNLNYKVDLFVSVNEEKAIERTEALEGIKRWAVVPRYALVPLPVRNDEVMLECIDLINQTNEIGSVVASEVRDFLNAERSLLLRR